MKLPNVKKNAVSNAVLPFGSNKCEPTIASSNLFWDLYRDGITQSALGTFLSCPENMRLAYIQALESVKDNTEALDFGSFMHDCMDAVYFAYSMHPDQASFVVPENLIPYIEGTCDNLWDIKYEYAVSSGEEWQNLDIVHGLTRMMLPKYYAYWEKADFDERETWVALEKTFDVKIEVNGKTIRVRGKWDGIKRIKGKLWLLETKTKGRINEENIQDSLPIDLQTNLYLWAIWMTYGEFPAGVIYNVIRKPGERLKKDEGTSAYVARVAERMAKEPEHYFLRITGEIMPTEIRKWEAEFRVILTQLMAWYSGQFHYKNPLSCTRYYGPCPFTKMCGAGQAGYYRRRKQLFPELNLQALKDILVPAKDALGDLL